MANLGHPLLHITHATTDTAMGGTGQFILLFLLYGCRPLQLLVYFSSFIRGPVFHPIDDCEHSLLYLPGNGIASKERAISGSCQQNLADICNSVCVWWLYMGWIPGWGSLLTVFYSVLASNFVSENPFMGILFPILKMNEVSTLWSSFFLSFVCFATSRKFTVIKQQQNNFMIGDPHNMRNYRSFFEWGTKYPCQELQRQSLELRQKDRLSRDYPTRGSIPYTTTKPRHYCICQKDFADRTLTQISLVRLCQCLANTEVDAHSHQLDGTQGP